MTGIRRRDFLHIIPATVFFVMAPARSSPKDPAVGIALGAGGASGLAHILMLEALDELGIKPVQIAGSSIGAIIGALYASGMSGAEIRAEVESFVFASEDQPFSDWVSSDALEWVEFIEVELGKGGLLSSDGFLSYLFDKLGVVSFDELDIPLVITAANLWTRKQVILGKGALLPAIRASMALPGVFEPAIIDDQVLIDGGTVNPVPYDLLRDDCDLVIGIDVSGERSPGTKNAKPGYFETLFNAAKVMQRAIMTEKRRRDPADIYIAPKIKDVRALEFYRAKEIFAQAAPAKQALKTQLIEALN